ncbi:MAG: beta-glucosidase BglX [Eubacteriales bacterium]|nr:beta-glucosidase BglX [Eubacteriales bacterium]
MTEKELRRLVKDMSRKEKIGQLLQLPGALLSGGEEVATGPLAELGLSEEDVYLAGSVLGVWSPGEIRRLQQSYVKRHPHHIPLLFMLDVINGCDTIYPIPLGLGATFDPALVKKLSKMSARETALNGIHVTFSPMVDTVRDARWGRCMESTGEDPYLNRVMARAMVRGYQGREYERTGTFEDSRVAACVKHFAAYGAPTAGRDYNNVELSERTLREDYLPAYQAAVDAGVSMVMTSFNTLNRVPSTGNRWLMHDVLRREWGFEGVVITDYAAVAEMLAHGIAEDAREAARLAMAADVDIEMCTSCYPRELPGLLEDRTVSEKQLDAAVMRVLSLKNALGLFENPYRDLDEERVEQECLSDENRRKARRGAEESFVLLKNDGILPLAPETKTALIGPYIDSREMYGAWSFIDSESVVSIREAAEKKKNKSVPFTFAKGCEILDRGTKLIGFTDVYENTATEEEEERMLEEAVAAAKEADTAVLCLGEHRAQSGEAASRAEITLPECQLRLLRAVAAVNPNTAVVLFNGRPLDLREVSELAKAILVVWFPGTEGGSAIVNTLLGRNNPSGKLPISFPYCVGQVPVHYAQLITGRPLAGSDPNNRFLSRYTDIPNEPLYPFGFGLSYTTFEISPVRLDTAEISRNKKAENRSLTATVTVTNTGDRAGCEVVQLYLRDYAGSVARPIRELRGFERVTLGAGESAEVSFTVTEKMLRFWTIDGAYASEPGRFALYIGSSSGTENGADFTLC